VEVLPPLQQDSPTPSDRLPTAAEGGAGDAMAVPRTTGMTLAGVPVTPEVAAIVLVYFVQGILGRGLHSFTLELNLSNSRTHS